MVVESRSYCALEDNPEVEDIEHLQKLQDMPVQEEKQEVEQIVLRVMVAVVVDRQVLEHKLEEVDKQLEVQMVNHWNRRFLVGMEQGHYNNLDYHHTVRNLVEEMDLDTEVENHHQNDLRRMDS